MFRVGVITVMLCAALRATVSADPNTIVFAPVPTVHVSCVWSNGQAIAAVQGDSISMWLVLESTNLSSTRYMRLWCMFQNRSQGEFLFEPRTTFSIQATDPKKAVTFSLEPESPQHVLAQISDDKTSALIFAAIAGAFRAFKAQQVPPTTITGTGSQSGNGFVVNDAQEKRDALSERATAQTIQAATNTATWYDTFSSSVSEGVLRRNTMFSGKTVNGYVYFPRFADMPTEAGPNRSLEKYSGAVTHAQQDYYEGVQRMLNRANTCDFEVHVNLQGQSFAIRFRPVPAE